MARGAARACVLVACAAGALASFADSSSAQTRSIAQVERDRRAEDARAQRLRAQADATRAEIATLDGRLVESGQRRAQAEAAASAAELQLATLNTEVASETERRTHARDALEAALISAAFAQRRIEPRAIRAGIFARASAPEFGAAERQSGMAIANAQILAVAVTNQQRALVDAQAAIDSERAELVTIMAQRRTAAAAFAQNADAAERHANQLAAEAHTLRELAQRVQRPLPRGAGTPAAIIPAAWLAPAQGSIARGFGARDSGGQAAQGAVLHTRAGAQVVAPSSGRVAYAGLFRSYGQVLILNLDGGYVLVLTGLESINARVGETVRAGQPVGEMSGSAAAAPELYVEVRRQGRPIDPGRWLTSRGLSAERDVRAG